MSGGFGRAEPEELDRRGFLARSALAAGAGLIAGGLGPLLSACDPAAIAAPPRQRRPPSPDHPVVWPVRDSNQAIADGLDPERGATLRVFTWNGHVNQQCLNDFAAKYRCGVELATFATFGQALTTVSGGRKGGTYDVLLGAPNYMIGPLVSRGIIQPLNHTYIHNIRNVWPPLHRPLLRRRLALQRPLHRLHHRHRLAPRPARCRPLHARQRLELALARRRCLDQVGHGKQNRGPRRLPAVDRAGLRSWIHLAWSGQVSLAAQFLPKGISSDVLGYWFPLDGSGPVGNDTGTVLRDARSPVLAHLLLNYLLDNRNAMLNIAGTGYTQPLSYVTPGRLVDEGILPRSLTSTCVLSTYMDRGLKELQLPLAAAQLWEQAWRTVGRQRTPQ